MRIARRGAYAALVGVGNLIGAAGIAGAATGNSAAPRVDRVAMTAGGGRVDNAGKVEHRTEVDNGGIEAPGSDEKSDEVWYASSISIPGGVGPANEPEEPTSLAGLATVTPVDASAAALAVQSGMVNKVELESENGNLVYGVEIDTGTGVVDLKIDAGDASALETGDGERHEGDHESDDDSNSGTGWHARGG